MTKYTLLAISQLNFRRRGKAIIPLVLSLSLFLPGLARADIVYGSVLGVTPNNLTLVVYKDEHPVTSTAIRLVGNNQYEYNLNLPAGSYTIIYNDISRSVVNYPGTNRVNINFNK